MGSTSRPAAVTPATPTEAAAVISVGAALARVALSTPVPVAAATGGAALAARRPPGPKLRSAFQHFAAGLVFATAATELVPDLVRDHDAPAVIGGFAVGIVVMLAIDVLPARLAARNGRDSSAAALVAIAVDVFLDGVLIGIGFVEGGGAGLLLTVALTVELAFLGVAVATAVQSSGASSKRMIATTAAVASTIILGGILGATVFSQVGRGPLSVVLAFGTVALLYLVTEELLTEAHEQPDTPLLTTMFFIGFLVLLLLSFAT